MSDKEWLARYCHMGLDMFVKEPPTEKIEANGEKVFQRVPFPIDPGDDKMEEFKKRMKQLRKNIINSLHVEIGRHWKSLMDQCLPEMKCKSFDHFLVLFRTKPYGNEMRRALHIVCHTMFSRENFIRMETTVMKKLKMRYGNCLVNGSLVKNSRRGGCIAKIGTRLKQTSFIDKIRDVGRKEKKEILYERRFSAKKPQEGVVTVIEATTQSHGFNGHIGLCSGHQDLINAKQGAQVLLDLKKLDLETFIESRMSSKDGPTSIEAVMKEWRSVKSKGVVVSTAATLDSPTSPLTVRTVRTTGDEKAMQAWSNGVSLTFSSFLLRHQQPSLIRLLLWLLLCLLFEFHEQLVSGW